ncbi:unnamed protein product [Pedinophyceae sp. YPF-701]|nr:unnamed protein product [Pedinophyceae sp. YPF-701]
MEAEYNNEHARCEEFVATDETACVGVPGASNRENCVLACVSRTCFDRVFQLEPLEEGQHDRVRADRYKECAKRDLRKRLKKRQRAGEL